MITPTRRFGRTELAMPVFTCGGMRYQQSWDDLPPERIEEAGQRNLEATILRALDLGITHIETARGYGSSEMQLGYILPRLPREKMIIQTKVAPSADPADFIATFEKSLSYLRLGHVDLLSLHGINLGEHLDWALRDGGCLDAAESLRQRGLCRHIGFSTHATADIILRAIESDRFDYVNLHFYFVNELNRAALEAAQAHDMGVFIISPNDKGGKLYEPSPQLRDLCAPLTPMAWNDLWCLAHRGIHTLSLGAARPEDFDAHTAALPHLPHAADVVAPIEARLRAQLIQTHGEAWCQRWPEGIPSYLHIPGQVNVQEILRLFTYAKALNLHAWAKMRYNLLGGNGGHWFPGETAARIDADAIRRACAASPFAEQIPAILAEAHALFADAPKKRLSQGGA